VGFQGGCAAAEDAVGWSMFEFECNRRRSYGFVRGFSEEFLIETATGFVGKVIEKFSIVWDAI
jgi:hypothetical protein